MKDYILNKLKELGNVSERIIEKNSKIDKSMMHFVIEAYKIDGIGYLSFIKMKAMLGLMKMETIVFTPLTKKMPLLSYDYIKAMGNDTLLLELYNTDEVAPRLPLMDDVKKEYSNLKDHDLGSHWYDPLKLSPTLAKRGKKQASIYNELTKKWIDAYFSSFKEKDEEDEDIKKENTKKYVDGLFENGGPSTDQFIKMIGKDDAYELFSKYIFSSTAESVKK